MFTPRRRGNTEFQRASPTIDLALCPRNSNRSSPVLFSLWDSSRSPYCPLTSVNSSFHLSVTNRLQQTHLPIKPVWKEPLGRKMHLKRGIASLALLFLELIYARPNLGGKALNENTISRRGKRPSPLLKALPEAAPFPAIFWQPVLD